MPVRAPTVGPPLTAGPGRRRGYGQYTPFRQILPPPTPIQTAQQDAGNVSSIAVAWANPTTAGSTLIACINCPGTITPPSGLGWTVVTTQAMSQGGSTWNIYAVTNAASQSGSQTWTVPAASYPCIVLVEYPAGSFVVPLVTDVHNENAVNIITPPNVGVGRVSPLGPATANDVAFLCVGNNDPNGQMTNLTAQGWTFINGTGVNGAATQAFCAQRIAASGSFPSVMAQVSAPGFTGNHFFEAFQFTLQAPIAVGLVATAQATTAATCAITTPVMLHGPSPYKATILGDGPALYWRLDETSGTTFADSSGNSRTGTIAGGSTYSLAQPGLLPTDTDTCVVGTSATGICITAPSGYTPFQPNGSLTFEAWLNIPSKTYLALVKSSLSNNGPVWQIGSDGSVVWVCTSVGGQVTWPAGTLPFNTPTHAVLTYNDSTLVAELFVNGVSQGQRTIATGDGFGNTTNGTAATAQLYFPGDAGNAAWDLTGSLDEVAVYGGVLSSTQIANHYSAASSAALGALQATAAATATVTIPPPVPYLTCSAQATTAASATLTAASQLTASAQDTTAASAIISPPLVAAGKGITQATATLTAPTALTLAANGTTAATAVLTAPTALTLAANGTTAAAAQVAVPVALAATAQATTQTTAPLTALAVLTASAQATTAAPAQLTAQAVLTASAQATTAASAQLTATALLTATAQATTAASAPVTIPQPITLSAQATTAAGSPAGFTVTSLTSGYQGGSATIVTASVNAANDTELVLWIANSVVGGSSTVSTVTGLGLTWTQQTTRAGTVTRLDCWTAPVGASPVSGAVTITLSAAANCCWDLDQVIGANLTTPLITSNTKVAAGTNATASSITFNTPVTGDQLMYACAIESAQTQTPNTGWTKLADRQSSSGTGTALATQFSPASPGTSGASTWASSAPQWDAIGIELSLASVSPLAIVIVPFVSPYAQATTAATATLTAPALLTETAQGTTAATALVTAAVAVTASAQATTAATAIISPPLVPFAQATTQATCTVVATSAPQLTCLAQGTTSATAIISPPVNPFAQATTQATALVTATALITASAQPVTAASATLTATALITATAQGATAATAPITAQALLSPFAQATTQATSGMQVPGVAFITLAAYGTSAATALVTAQQPITLAAYAVTATTALTTAAALLTASAQLTSSAQAVTTATALLTATAQGKTSATATATAAAVVQPFAQATTQALALATATTGFSPYAQAMTATSLVVTVPGVAFIAPFAQAAASANATVYAPSIPYITTAAVASAAASATVNAPAQLTPAARANSSATASLTAQAVLTATSTATVAAAAVVYIPIGVSLTVAAACTTQATVVVHIPKQTGSITAVGFVNGTTLTTVGVAIPITATGFVNGTTLASTPTVSQLFATGVVEPTPESVT